MAPSRMGKVERDALKAKFLASFTRNKCLIYMTCAQVDIAPSTYRRWKEVDPVFAEDCKNAEELVFDGVENMMWRRMEQEDWRAIEYYSSTKMKHRGFIKRNEMTGKDGEDLIRQFVPEEHHVAALAAFKEKFMAKGEPVTGDKTTDE